MEEQEIKRLIVVGNGFDLAHGLPTSYAHFMNFLQAFHHRYTDKQSQILKNLLDYRKTDIVTEWLDERVEIFSSLYEALVDYIPEDELWSSFEEALSRLDVSEVQSKFAETLTPYSSDDWHDSDNHTYPDSIREELGFVEKIPKAFREWIVESNIINSSSLPWVVELLRQDFNSNCTLFMSFNYTNTWERLYGVAPQKICYIHGCATKGTTLIVGHHNSQLLKFGEPEYFYQNDLERKRQDGSIYVPTDEQWEKMSDAERDEYSSYLDSVQPDIEDYEYNDPREYQGALAIQEYFSKTYKDTARIINEHSSFFTKLHGVSEVYILGHSLSDIDLDYFAEIKRRSSNNCVWNISYHTEEDKKKAENFAHKLNLAYSSVFHF